MNIGEILDSEESIISALKMLNKRGTTHVILENKGDVDEFVTGLVIPLNDYITEIEREFKMLHKEVEKYNK